jgi:hypothetical protein
MNYLDSWADIVAASVQNIWIGLINLLPALIGAVIVLIVGFLIAAGLGSAARRLVSVTGIDNLMHQHPMSDIMQRSQVRFTPSGAVGWLVKWFFILVTLIAVANSLGWTQINDFLSSLAFYVPNVLIAIVILVAGLLAGRFVSELIRAALAESALTTAQAGFVGSLAQAAIVVFAAMASLVQLKIAPSLIQILFGGIVLALSIAFGLAFGLGGREKASQLLQSPGWSNLRGRNNESLERPEKLS